MVPDSEALPAPMPLTVPTPGVPAVPAGTVMVTDVNVAAVALAAKHARIAWAMLAKGTEYQPAQPEEAAA